MINIGIIQQNIEDIGLNIGDLAEILVIIKNNSNLLRLYFDNLNHKQSICIQHSEYNISIDNAQQYIVDSIFLFGSQYCSEAQKFLSEWREKEIQSEIKFISISDLIGVTHQLAHYMHRFLSDNRNFKTKIGTKEPNPSQIINGPQNKQLKQQQQQSQTIVNNQMHECNSIEDNQFYFFQEIPAVINEILLVLQLQNQIKNNDLSEQFNGFNFDSLQPNILDTSLFDLEQCMAWQSSRMLIQNLFINGMKADLFLTLIENYQEDQNSNIQQKSTDKIIINDQQNIIYKFFGANYPVSLLQSNSSIINQLQLHHEQTQQQSLDMKQKETENIIKSDIQNDINEIFCQSIQRLFIFIISNSIASQLLHESHFHEEIIQSQSQLEYPQNEQINLINNQAIQIQQQRTSISTKYIQYLSNSYNLQGKEAMLQLWNYSSQTTSSSSNINPVLNKRPSQMIISLIRNYQKLAFQMSYNEDKQNKKARIKNVIRILNQEIASAVSLLEKKKVDISDKEIILEQSQWNMIDLRNDSQISQTLKYYKSLIIFELENILNSDIIPKLEQMKQFLIQMINLPNASNKVDASSLTLQTSLEIIQNQKINSSSSQNENIISLTWKQLNYFLSTFVISNCLQCRKVRLALKTLRTINSFIDRLSLINLFIVDYKSFIQQKDEQSQKEENNANNIQLNCYLENEIGLFLNENIIPNQLYYKIEQMVQDIETSLIQRISSPASDSQTHEIIEQSSKDNNFGENECIIQSVECFGSARSLLLTPQSDVDIVILTKDCGYRPKTISCSITDDNINYIYQQSNNLQQGEQSNKFKAINQEGCEKINDEDSFTVFNHPCINSLWTPGQELKITRYFPHQFRNQAITQHRKRHRQRKRQKKQDLMNQNDDHEDECVQQIDDNQKSNDKIKQNNDDRIDIQSDELLTIDHQQTTSSINNSNLNVHDQNQKYDIEQLAFNLQQSNTHINIMNIISNARIPVIKIIYDFEYINSIIEQQQKIYNNLSLETTNKDKSFHLVTEQQNIYCDVTLNNILPLFNSELIRTYILCDPRVQPLILLVKHWALKRGVVGAAHGFLSMYGWVLMVIAFLQLIRVIPDLQSKEYIQKAFEWRKWLREQERDQAIYEEKRRYFLHKQESKEAKIFDENKFSDFTDIYDGILNSSLEDQTIFDDEESSDNINNKVRTKEKQESKERIGFIDQNNPTRYCRTRQIDRIRYKEHLKELNKLAIQRCSGVGYGQDDNPYLLKENIKIGIQFSLDIWNWKEAQLRQQSMVNYAERLAVRIVNQLQCINKENLSLATILGYNTEELKIIPMNKMNISELFAGFFRFYAKEIKPQSGVLSIKQGRIIDLAQFQTSIQIGRKISQNKSQVQNKAEIDQNRGNDFEKQNNIFIPSFFYIQDPFISNRNVGKQVLYQNVQIVLDEISRASQILDAGGDLKKAMETKIEQQSN